MCGIVGKVSFSNKSVSTADVGRMRDVLDHRGPDDSGEFLSNDQKVGLGHRRLSILDTSSRGHQPMSYLDRYWIVFNGEIYNFQELRKQLEADNYTFSSGTDTEVILALYDKYNEECVQYLRGMFAFAIYDSKKNILFCARDRFGQKPFKYYMDGSVFIFSSELKSILTQSEYSKEPDWSAIHDYLTYQFVPSPATGFKHIHKLEPASYLVIDISKRSIQKKKYWHLNFSERSNVSEHEWIRLIQKNLEDATRMQMIADVSLGAFLSGGIDSSIVVGLMSNASTSPVKTFSIGFPEKEFNELSYSKQVAKHFKTDHTEFIVEPNAVDILPELVEAYEEPYADSSAIPTYYLSKLTREHVTVALTGDGGDEHFAGYSRYAFHKLALLLDAWKLDKLPIQNLIPKHLITNTLLMRADRFVRSLNQPYAKRYVNYLCYFTNDMKQSLYTTAFRQKITHDSADHMVRMFEESKTNDKGAQALYADAMMYLPDDLLVKVDIASMAVGLEARSPFLDHELANVAASIPTSLKLKGFTQSKYILKKTFSSLLPQEILHRKKMGFVMPIERWFRGDLSQYVDSLLLSPDTRITQYMCDKDAVKKLLHDHRTTKVNFAPPIWALLTLELWMRKYF